VKGTPGEHRQMDMSGHGKYLSEQGAGWRSHCHCCCIVTVIIVALSLLLLLHCCCCCCIVVVVVVVVVALLQSSHGEHRGAGLRVGTGESYSVAWDAAAIVGEHR